MEGARMEGFTPIASTDLHTEIYRLYRDYFDRAEKKRRWSLRDDIPWEECNRSIDPSIADVVESFCAVELYLPDYVDNAMTVFRSHRGWAWFYANWGYEESKHSLALGDWLLRSGMRSEEQMQDLQGIVLKHTWNMPQDSAVGMIIYAMVQELATGLNYRRLRCHVEEQGDPALCRLLNLLSVDEQAHHGFFLQAVRLFLKHDRAATLEQLYRVLHYFTMPVISDLIDGRARVEAVKAMRIFDEQIYFDKVYTPVLEALGVTRQELRRHAPHRKSSA
jgi:acyl-[acyl-carrier-protein] desaturase